MFGALDTVGGPSGRRLIDFSSREATYAHVIRELKPSRSVEEQIQAARKPQATHDAAIGGG